MEKSSALSGVLHPLILIVVIVQVYTVSAAYLPKYSKFRYVSILTIAILSSTAIYNFQSFIKCKNILPTMLGGAFFVMILSATDRLLLRQWTYGEHFVGPVDTSEEDRKKQPRMEFGSQVSGSSRLPGTAYEVANIPHFDEKDHSYVPSRTYFILHHLGAVVLLYFLNSFAVEMQLGYGTDHMKNEFIPFLARIKDVTAREIYVRIVNTIGFWISTYVYLQTLCSIGYILRAIFTPNEIKLCRPLFGYISTSYTLRNFWGKFWHQNLRMNGVSHSKFITHSLLRIPKGTLIARYSNILFPFVLSAIMHLIANHAGGVSVKESGAFRAFTIQTLGIMLEDTVQFLLRGKVKALISRPVGFLWVVLFLAWSTPTWTYPALRIQSRDDLYLTPASFKPMIGWWL